MDGCPGEGDGGDQEMRELMARRHSLGRTDRAC